MSATENNSKPEENQENGAETMESENNETTTGNTTQDESKKNDDAPKHDGNKKYIEELLKEKIGLDRSKRPHACRLIDEEIKKAQSSEVLVSTKEDFFDIKNDRPVRLTIKVLIPTEGNQQANIIPRLLGPKGSNLRQLSTDTRCRMSLLGRGSIKDKSVEEKLRNSGEQRSLHLFDDLHVLVVAKGPPAEVYARFAYALSELRKFFAPTDVQPGNDMSYLAPDMLDRNNVPKPLMSISAAPLMRGGPPRPPPSFGNYGAGPGPMGGGYDDDWYEGDDYGPPQMNNAPYGFENFNNRGNHEQGRWNMQAGRQRPAPYNKERRF